MNALEFIGTLSAGAVFGFFICAALTLAKEHGNEEH